MPVVTCNSCGRQLRLPEGVGPHRRARCPQCGTIFAVAGASPIPSEGSAPGAAAAAAPTAERWHVKAPDGATYGPVSKGELDAWASERRITAESQLLREGEERWLWASEVYPCLRTFPHAGSAASQAMGNPFAAAGGAPLNPYASPAAVGAYAAHGGWRRPHRGGLILALAILGWMFCPILSFIAWIMGHGDLRQIRMGMMDPAGHGLTQAGMIVGMIHCALIAVMLVFYVLMIIFFVGLGAFA